MKIYVASSWRNERQPEVVEALRSAGHEVYDFRNPKPGATGFSWRKVLNQPPPWSAEQTREVLSHEVSQAGFDLDFEAMQWADTFVMVQPCGRSAALELGWAAGAQKRTCVLLADAQEPELMLKCADLIAVTLEEVLAFLAPTRPQPALAARECRNCAHWGADPDGAYCVHPTVAHGYQYGIALHTMTAASRCPAPEHPHFEARKVGER